MARILRGDIRWADLSPVRGHEQAGRRPILVLSHDVHGRIHGTGPMGRFNTWLAVHITKTVGSMYQPLG